MIAPSTNIYLCHGVPIDKNYNHTLYFTDNVQQLNTFMSYVKFAQVDYTYQRQNIGVVKVNLAYDVLTDINYMFFQNTAYANKWFYAFVDSIEYVNDVTTKVYFTIDEMQTWYFDYIMPPCMIEREHTETDGVGEHLIDEGINTGDFVVEQEYNYTFSDNGATLADNKFILAIYYLPNINGAGQYNILRPINSQGGYINNAATELVTYQINTQGAYEFGRVINSIYRGSGCCILPYSLRNGGSSEILKININNFINQAIRMQFNILAMYVFPSTLFWNSHYTLPESPVSASRPLTYQTFQHNLFYSEDHTSSYTAINKKLLSFPYQQIVIDNNSGDTVTYKWEKSMSSQLTGLKILNTEISSWGDDDMQVILYPHVYDGLTDNIREAIILKDFISIPWAEDSYSRWWSQYKTGFIISAVGSGLKAATKVGAGVALVAASGGAPITEISGESELISSAIKAGNQLSHFNASPEINNILNLFSTYKEEKNTPDNVLGKTQINEITLAADKIGFTVYSLTIQKDVAESIDMFFSMYGYKVNTVKIPNVRNPAAAKRKHWNYVKTINSICLPIANKGVPQDSLNTISKVYDHGITFWNYPTEVGNYNLASDNIPGA